MAFYSLDQSQWNHVRISDPNDGTNNGDGITNENEIDEEASKNSPSNLILKTKTEMTIPKSKI